MHIYERNGKGLERIFSSLPGLVPGMGYGIMLFEEFIYRVISPSVSLVMPSGKSGLKNHCKQFHQLKLIQVPNNFFLNRLASQTWHLENQRGGDL